MPGDHIPDILEMQALGTVLKEEHSWHVGGPSSIPVRLGPGSPEQLRHQHLCRNPPPQPPRLHSKSEPHYCEACEKAERGLYPILRPVDLGFALDSLS